MEEKAASRRSDKNTVLGGAGAEQGRNAPSADRREKSPAKSGGEESASIAGLLAEFVSDLKKAAAEKQINDEKTPIELNIPLDEVKDNTKSKKT
jgi:hypothetical protein